MKKLFAIVLLLVYGLSSSGMSVTLHYCCGKLDKISLYPKYDGCKPGKISKKGCCDNKELNFKIKADQETTSHKQVSSFSAANTIQNSITAGTDIIFRYTAVNEYSTGPPAFHSSPLLILNCVFRI